MCSICFSFALLSHSALIILPSDQILLQASVLLTSSVCHLAVRPGSHGLLLKLLQLGGGDRFPRDRITIQTSQSPEACTSSQGAGREAQPVVSSFGERGWSSSQVWSQTAQSNNLAGQHTCLRIYMCGCHGWQGGWTTLADANIAPSWSPFRGLSPGP